MNSSLHYDVIVVGTGPGGATVARELSKKKKKVLMIERGSNPVIKGSALQAATMFMPGKATLFTYGALAMVRGITMGGSSIFYYATAFPPPVAMLKKYGIDITKEIEDCKKELPIAPLKDELIGPMAHRIMQSARELGYPWDKLPKFVFQDKCRSNCDKCNLGCPYGAKFNARMWAEEAMTMGATLLTNTKVKKVIFDGKKAVGVEYSQGFKTGKAYANDIVIAAGGIGSPIILRNSGIKGAGFDYFFDPLICVMGTVKDIKGGREFPMATGHQFVDDGYVMTDMTIPKLLYQGFTAEVGRFDRIFSHSHTLQIMIKEKDSLGGYLTNTEGVRKRLADSDKKKLMHGYDRAKNILKNAGAKHIFKSWYVAAHPGGTVKIGHLLDKNLQTEKEHLYVCDCSVIPEAWGLPPALTLYSLGKRLAKHLAKTK